VPRVDTGDDDLDVLLGGAARLGERVGERGDHLRHGLLRDAAVVELDLDDGHRSSSLVD
jgi:hypothetical protein